MSTVYHGSSQTQSPATFNPYLPTIGRIYQVLQDYAPAGTAIQICNRDLARAVGLRSAGGIPALLRRLEAKGHIERITTPQGSLIVVLGDHGIIDRPHSASGCDQTIDDRSEVETPAALPDRSRMADRPKNRLYGTKHDQHEHEQLAHTSNADHPTYQALIQAGAAPTVADRILVTNPDLTIAAFDTLCQQARQRSRRRSDGSIGLVFHCLLHNEPLYTPKEPRHEQPATRRPAGARRGSETHRPDRTADLAPAVDYDALLAEWEHTAPTQTAAVYVSG